MESSGKKRNVINLKEKNYKSEENVKIKLERKTEGKYFKQY